MERGQIPDLVRRLFGAYQSKDRKVMEELLSDDFTFTSPYDDHIDRTAYFERCWPNSDRIRMHHLKRIIQDGDEAFVYDCETVSGDRFRNTERLISRTRSISAIRR
jgi:ketosteroid isomerase-like protein